jgi:hypothetical protein
MVKEYPAMHFLYCHAQKDLRRQLVHMVAGTLLAAQDEGEGRKRKQKVSMGELERGLWLNMDDRQVNDPGQLQARLGLLLAVSTKHIRDSLRIFHITSLTDVCMDDIKSLILEYWREAATRSVNAFKHWLELYYPEVELNGRKRKHAGDQGMMMDMPMGYEEDNEDEEEQALEGEGINMAGVGQQQDRIAEEQRVEEPMEEEVTLIETETRMEENVAMEVDRFLAAMKDISHLEEMTEEE